MEPQTPTETTPTSNQPEIPAKGRGGPGVYTKEQRLYLLKAFEAWEGTLEDFCRQHKVNRVTLWAWKRAYQATVRRAWKTEWAWERITKRGNPGTPRIRNVKLWKPARKQSANKKSPT